MSVSAPVGDVQLRPDQQDLKRLELKHHDPKRREQKVKRNKASPYTAMSSFYVKVGFLLSQHPTPLLAIANKKAFFSGGQEK